MAIGAALGLLALSLAACWGPSGAQTTAGRPASRAGLAKSPAPLVLGAALTGQVLLPASVLAAHASLFQAKGGGILSNNGGSLVGAGGGILSNHGAGWRLLQQGEAKPLVGAELQLLSAQGQALRGPDAKPLRSTSDAEGRFRFPASPQGQAYLVAVALPPSVGPMVALVPKATSEAPKPLRVDGESTALVALVLEELLPLGSGAQAGLDAIEVGQAEAFQTAVSSAIAKETPLTSFLKPELLPWLDRLQARELPVAEAAQALKGAVQAVVALPLPPSAQPLPQGGSSSAAPSPTPLPSGSPWPVASYSDNLSVHVALRWPAGQGLKLSAPGVGTDARRFSARLLADGYQTVAGTGTTQVLADADQMGCTFEVPYPRAFSGTIPYRLVLNDGSLVRFNLPSVVLQVGTLKGDMVTELLGESPTPPASVAFSATTLRQLRVQVKRSTGQAYPGVTVLLNNAYTLGGQVKVAPLTTDAQGVANFAPIQMPVNLSYNLSISGRNTGTTLDCVQVGCNSTQAASHLSSEVLFQVALPDADGAASAPSNVP